MATTAELFQALEGVRFVYAGRMVLTLRPGLYENGRGAITVDSDEGPYAVLTVNLPEEELADDELFVRSGAKGHTDFVEVRAVVATARFWTTDGLSVGAGYVGDYARVWKWRRCLGVASPDFEAGHVAGYAVLCPACRLLVEKRYEDEIERIRAADAVKRLRRARPEEDDDEYQ